jgi:hypothetical protein
LQTAGVGNSGVFTLLLPRYAASSVACPAVKVTFGPTGADGTVVLGKASYAAPLTFTSLGGAWNNATIGAPFNFTAQQLQFIIAVRPTAVVDVHELRAILFYGNPAVDPSDALGPLDSGWVAYPASTFTNVLAGASFDMATICSYAAPVGTIDAGMLSAHSLYTGLTNAEVSPLINRLLGYSTTAAEGTLFPTAVTFTNQALTSGIATFADRDPLAFVNASAALTTQAIALDMSRMNGPFAWARPMPGAPVFYVDQDLS